MQCHEYCLVFLRILGLAVNILLGLAVNILLGLAVNILRPRNPTEITEVEKPQRSCLNCLN